MSSKKNIIDVDVKVFECQCLIEYISLLKLLLALNRKKKDLENKVNILDGRMIEKDKRILELEKYENVIRNKKTFYKIEEINI